MTGADAISNAVTKKTPGQPRQIRAQVGLTEDPLPEGKTIAHPKHHHKVEHAGHGSSDPGNELTKQGIEWHKDELKHMQHQPAKYDTAQKGPLHNNGPGQSMTDMGARRGQ